MNTPAPVTLAQLIGWIESRNNPGAIRFESGVYGGKKTASIIQRIYGLHACSIETACMIYSTSWGEFQIMGFNLYGDLGFAFTVAQYLNAPDAQLETFEQFIDSRNLSNTTPQSLLDIRNATFFARTYNGSAGYAANIRDALSHFGVTAK